MNENLETSNHRDQWSGFKKIWVNVCSAIHMFFIHLDKITENFYTKVSQVESCEIDITTLIYLSREIGKGTQTRTIQYKCTTFLLMSLSYYVESL